MAIVDSQTVLPRSYLFVPGSRPERFAKALTSGADAVIVDLEDAVAESEKASARQALVNWLDGQAPVYVRINGYGTPWYEEDLAALGWHPSVAGLVIPKAWDPAQLESLVSQCRPGLTLLPIIESAAGFAAMQDVAQVPDVQRLMFGTIDFQVDLGTQLSEQELNTYRCQFALVSRLASIGSPVDGVTTVLDDDAVLQEAARQSRRFGFGAKLCIHPRQVTAVHAGFRASPSECDWARRVLHAAAASGGEATVVDGEMVDVPVILRARAILHSQEQKAGGLSA
ncbi:citrate lyase beta subunit [Pseudomonas sp. GM49]|uniref:HpcH/HpaI aldolase/citrate lyase family protein n=1 Tax=Pseudomonas sp. GM49 TaxID=1144331 RepID=UPI00027040DB|nr:CoA ester lyase [Pseudomonas sp. GM49]EJM57803.1 citrate lyase beta subunit [Pseudomonas sp. GM49]